MDLSAGEPHTASGISTTVGAGMHKSPYTLVRKMAVTVHGLLCQQMRANRREPTSWTRAGVMRTRRPITLSRLSAADRRQVSSARWASGRALMVASPMPCRHKCC